MVVLIIPRIQISLVLSSFTYTLSDGNGGSATASVNITVSDENDSPTANDDSATTAEDTPIDILVLGNDEDPDGDDPSLESATQGTNGTTSTDGTTVTYYSKPDSCWR